MNDSLGNLVNTFGYIEQNLSNIPELISSITAVIILSLIVSFYYLKFGSSMSGRSQIAKSLVLLSMVVFMVISVVKASLALSLGLVGALSIVRFRTPVKEAEELIFLFFAIAIGLGIGANHIIFTSFVIAISLIVHYFMNARKQINNSKFAVLVIEGITNKKNEANIIKNINNSVKKYFSYVELKNILVSSNVFTIDYYITTKLDNDIGISLNELKKINGVKDIKFIDSSEIPGV